MIGLSPFNCITARHSLYKCIRIKGERSSSRDTDRKDPVRLSRSSPLGLGNRHLVSRDLELPKIVPVCAEFTYPVILKIGGGDLLISSLDWEN